MMNNKFYFLLTILILIITLMLIYINPFTFFAKKQLSKEALYIYDVIRLNNTILKYNDTHNDYPASLDNIYFDNKDIFKFIEYKKTNNGYYLKTLIPIYDSILIFFPNHIEKRAYEE